MHRGYRNPIAEIPKECAQVKYHLDIGYHIVMIFQIEKSIKG